MTIKDGLALPSDEAGLGIDWDFNAIEKRAVAGWHGLVIFITSDRFGLK
jgi:L-alanine-DL-glutamate epimerase-like enolase superfamily enzyme